MVACSESLVGPFWRNHSLQRIVAILICRAPLSWPGQKFLITAPYHHDLGLQLSVPHPHLSSLIVTSNRSTITYIVYLVYSAASRASQHDKMATMANHDRATTQPTCQNCTTHTTPLWRRDETGAVLCNACGLFLKLHGRPRPISLKTDVIKSRNRVKTMRPDLAKQKKVRAFPCGTQGTPGTDRDQAQTQQHHGLSQAGDMNGADLGNGAAGPRRASQKSANGGLDDTNSPISRTGTPNLYASHMGPIYQNIDDQFQAQQLSGFGGPDGRPQSPLNGDRLDMPQTHEQLLATNASLKTRVSELEVIQELYRGRIQQLEQEEANRQAQEKSKSEADEQLHVQLSVMNEAQSQLQKELEESHRRENMLKRRLDELEVELKDAKESLEVHENGRAKKARIDDVAPDTDEAASTPQSAS